MIKYITFVYTVGSGPITPVAEYCETKGSQSPYVKQVDEVPVALPLYVPVTTCNIDAANVDDMKKALLQCVKIRQNWHKL